MYDIIEVLLSPGAKPFSGDKLAILLSVPDLRQYFDHSAMTFLTEVYQRSALSVEGNLVRERDNFAAKLIENFVDLNGATPKFIDSLKKNCDALKNFVVALQGKSKNQCQGSGGGSLQLGGSGSSGGITATAAQLEGGPKTFAGLFGGVMDPKGPVAAAGAAPKLSIFAGRDPSQGVGGTVVPPVNADPNQTQPPVPTSDPSVVPQPIPVDPNGGAGGMPTSFDEMLAKMFGPEWSQMLGDNGSSGLTLSGTKAGLALSAPKRILPSAPKFNCVSEGFEGKDLVLCQRYFATLPELKLPEGYQRKMSSSSGRGFGLEGGTAYNFALLAAGMASTVQDQGSEGACSAFAVTHTALANLAALGSPTSLDAWTVWRTQGQTPTANAAMNALSQLNIGGARKLNQRRLTDLSELKAVLDQKRAIYIATEVSQDWYRPNGSLKCNGARTGRHGYSLHGYDDAKQLFVVKNSWGADWGEEGYHYLPYKCIDSFRESEYYDLQYQ